MKDQNSLIYPCVMKFSGQFCSGSAIRTNEYKHRDDIRQHRVVYVCRKCASTWSELGHPATKYKEWSKP